MLKRSNVRTDILSFLLVELVVSLAVVIDLREWDGLCFSVCKGESLIKIWAVFKTIDIRSDILLLGKLICGITVVVDLWVWNSSCLSISKSESFIKVWAVLKAVNRWTPVRIILFRHLI